MFDGRSVIRREEEEEALSWKRGETLATWERRHHLWPIVSSFSLRAEPSRADQPFALGRSCSNWHERQTDHPQTPEDKGWC